MPSQARDKHTTDQKRGLCPSTLHGAQDDHAGYAIGIHQDDQGLALEAQPAASALDASGMAKPPPPPDPGKGVHVTDITYRHIRSTGLFGGSFLCTAGALACTGITLEDIHLNVSRSGKKTAIFLSFLTKHDPLSRQARDKHKGKLEMDLPYRLFSGCEFANVAGRSTDVEPSSCRLPQAQGSGASAQGPVPSE